jgi:hypothetical protein
MCEVMCEVMERKSRRKPHIFEFVESSGKAQCASHPQPQMMEAATLNHSVVLTHANKRINERITGPASG